MTKGRLVAPLLSITSYRGYQENLRKENKTEIGFIVVRHPFERLVSAYRDKLERTHTPLPRLDYYYKKYGQKIVEKYRKRALQKLGDDFFR